MDADPPHGCFYYRRIRNAGMPPSVTAAGRRDSSPGGGGAKRRRAMQGCGFRGAEGGG